LRGLSADNPKSESLILWPAMNNRIAPETQLITKRLSLRSKISPTTAIPNIIRTAETGPLWVESLAFHDFRSLAAYSLVACKRS
jgi:hypothetical protein